MKVGSPPFNFTAPSQPVRIFRIRKGVLKKVTRKYLYVYAYDIIEMYLKITIRNS